MYKVVMSISDTL